MTVNVTMADEFALGDVVMGIPVNIIPGGRVGEGNKTKILQIIVSV